MCLGLVDVKMPVSRHYTMKMKDGKRILRTIKTCPPGFSYPAFGAQVHNSTPFVPPEEKSKVKAHLSNPYRPCNMPLPTSLCCGNNKQQPSPPLPPETCRDLKPDAASLRGISSANCFPLYAKYSHLSPTVPRSSLPAALPLRGDANYRHR